MAEQYRDQSKPIQGHPNFSPSEFTTPTEATYSPPPAEPWPLPLHYSESSVERSEPHPVPPAHNRTLLQYEVSSPAVSDSDTLADSSPLETNQYLEVTEENNRLNCENATLQARLNQATKDAERLASENTLLNRERQGLNDAQRLLIVMLNSFSTRLYANQLTFQQKLETYSSQSLENQEKFIDIVTKAGDFQNASHNDIMESFGRLETQRNSLEYAPINGLPTWPPATKVEFPQNLSFQVANQPMSFTNAEYGNQVYTSSSQPGFSMPIKSESSSGAQCPNCLHQESWMVEDGRKRKREN
jgi:regulator of replication initiation timing